MTASAIFASRGLIMLDRLQPMKSWDDLLDYTGPCVGGPWDGYTLSDGKPLVRLEAGSYRFLDHKWRWRAEA